ncbi:MAG TPA: hypothetical protein VFK47_17995 [Ktedonobacteraceae bacterium]|nr:hypothetical protein [Ktedonobacteraceae bacterium]
MRGQRSQENRFEQMDDFEQPTEPMSQVFLTPFSAPTYQAGALVDQQGVPMPQLDERPFPKSGAAPVDVFGTPPVYPVLPPAPPESSKGRPPGGAPPLILPGKPEAFAPRKPRRSSFPVLVGLFFVAVELFLLLRLVVQIIGLTDNSVWVGLVNTISTVFLLPFLLLLENVKIPLIYGTELYSELLIVFALFVYGLLSRVLVRFLKALLNSR